MKITNLKDKWCIKVELDSPDEVYTQDSNFWKRLLYNNHLLVFKNMNFRMEDYYKFSKLFGNPMAYTKNCEYPGYPGLHKFSNRTIAQIGEEAMPWHADLPNCPINPFPIRSLWMTKNPNPSCGLTSFLNLTDSIELLSDKLKNLLNRITIVQQEWEAPEIDEYTPGLNKQEFDIFKIHPVTGTKSLRLNSFNSPGIKNSWIRELIIDGISTEDCSLVREFLNDIASHESMIYTHTWDTNDILVYDNWSLVHKRTALQLPPDTVRLIYRINILHDMIQWCV